MIRKEYDTPELKVSIFHEEDIVRTSVFMDEDEKGNNIVVGPFDNGWLT